MRVTVTISSRGIATLPAKLRQTLGLQADDQLITETTPKGLLLRPAATLSASAMRVLLDADILLRAAQSDGAALGLVSLRLDRGHAQRRGQVLPTARR